MFCISGVSTAEAPLKGVEIESALYDAAGAPLVVKSIYCGNAMSLKIGELGVLPKIRAAAPSALLAANGTSCRHQIADATGREARHLVRILDDASAAMGI